VIGHLKNDGHLGRNFLKGYAGDHANAVLSAVGYNFRLILAWLRLLLRLIVASLASLAQGLRRSRRHNQLLNGRRFNLVDVVLTTLLWAIVPLQRSPAGTESDGYQFDMAGADTVGHLDRYAA